MLLAVFQKLSSLNPLVKVLHKMVDIKNLLDLFLGIVGIICMPIGLFYNIQMPIRLSKSLHHFRLGSKHRKKAITEVAAEILASSDADGVVLFS